MKAMTSSKSTESLHGTFTCPLCLRNSHLPAVLQCMHFFCKECVSQEDGESTCLVTCPFCNSKQPFQQPSFKGNIDDILKDEDLKCGPCKAESKQSPAANASHHCVDCDEYLCENCNTHHAKFKITKHHTSFKLGENVSLFPNRSICGVCKDQTSRSVEFVCQEHDLMCCGTCAIRSHKDCSIHEIEYLVDQIRSKSLIDDLHLALEESKNKMRLIVDASEENSTRLELQTAEIRKSVIDLRKKINDLIDAFEVDVINGSCEILEREKESNTDQIKTCRKFIAAVNQSRELFDKAIQHTSSANFYDIFKNGQNHNVTYASFIKKTLESKTFTELDLVVDSNIADILENGRLGVLSTKASSIGITPSKKKTIERTKFVLAVTKLEGRIPRYSSATYLSNEKICLIDCNNKRCCLFDSSFHCLDVVSFNSCPWTTAYINSKELAVSLPLERNIQFYTVNANKLLESRCISTLLPCWGVAPADEGNIAVAVDCKGTSPGVGIIGTDGKELFKLRADETELNFGQPWQFDYDLKRCRFLISCESRDSVVCINKKGRIIFEYKSEKLTNPAGISHDGDGNIYICGLKSNNIHQINPNGELMRIIALPKLRTPFSICFCKQSDEFLVTTVENREELQLFSLS